VDQNHWLAGTLHDDVKECTFDLNESRGGVGVTVRNT
jgi:hypothetical protein